MLVVGAHDKEGIINYASNRIVAEQIGFKVCGTTGIITNQSAKERGNRNEIGFLLIRKILESKE